MPAERKVAVLTGAGRGIGRAMALELAARGYDLGLQARSVDQLEAVRAELEALGARVVNVPGDVTERSAAEALVEKTESALGPVVAAIAAAGQARSLPVLKTEASVLRELFEVNVVASMHLLQVAAARMIAQRRAGRIVLVGSTASVRGFRYTAAYSASKHALLGFARSAALELAPKGVTVNVLCPGWVDTPMFEDTLKNISEKTGGTLEQARARIEQMIPVGKVLQPEEVAAMLRYVLSDDAAKLTGQALILDGGETL